MKNFIFWLSRHLNFPLVSPEVMQISLTYRCNLYCRMCSIAGLLPKEQELSTEQIYHVLDEAKKNGIKEIILTGGEPFLREDIFKICEYCRQKGLRSIVTTNGVLIDREIARAIRDSGISHVHFSFDGLKETNDFFRGKGTFEKVLEAASILNKLRGKNNPFSLGFACTVMNENISELYKIIKLADDMGIDVINFQPLIKNNANFIDNAASSFFIKNENIPFLEQEIKKIRQYKSKKIKIFEEPRLELLFKYYQGKLTKKDWVCFGGFKTVFICYEKNKPLAYSCHGICGNLDKISLKRAWRSKEAHQLRLHSQNCNNLCLQSCYSLEAAQSLRQMLKSFLRCDN